MTEQQIKAHLNCWRRLSAVKTALALSEAEPRRERSCPTHHVGDPGPEEAGQGEVHLSSLYLFFLSRSLRRELRPPPSQSHTKCKIFYPKRKVQRTLAAVMSFPYDSKPLGSSLGQPEFTFKSILFPVLL